MKRLIIIAMLAALTGCAAVKPTSVRVYAEHVSHITQHEPFTSDPQECGYNALTLELHWQHGPAFLDVGDGYNISPAHNGGANYGALFGPREVFHARAGMEFGL